MPKWVPAVLIVIAVVVVALVAWKMTGRSGPPTVDRDVQVRPNMYNLREEIRKGNVGRRQMPPVSNAPGGN